MRKKQKEQTESNLPPDDFNDWWYPTGTDELSGASIGGHPDAERTWSRRDGSFWKRRRYGINALAAWQCEIYREEFEHWQNNGSPPRATEFVSNAATLPRQREFWSSIRDLLAKMQPKKIPRLKPAEVQAEARRMGLPTKMVEPLDEKDSNEPF